MLVRASAIALIVTAVAAAVVVRAESREGAASHGWKLILDDSFNGPRLDRHVWRLYGTGSAWPGNAGHGVRVARAVTVQRGNAVITAREVNGVVESGGFTVRPPYYTRYGRFEARLRVDAAGSGVMSAVALTWPVSNHRSGGELDFYETGPQRKDIKSFVHPGGDVPPKACVHPLSPTRWHVVTMVWKPNRLHFDVDGVSGCTFTRPALIPDATHRLTFQYDAFADHLGSTVTRMQIARVKLWRRAG